MLEYWKLVVWSQIWYWIWLFGQYVKPKCKENCLTWALKKWKTGDYYLVIRWARSSKSSFFPHPHFLLLPKQYHRNLIHFVPKVKTDEKRYFPKIWFDGRVKRGDPEEEIDEN